MLGELVVLINFLFEVLEFYKSTQVFNFQLESIFFSYFLTEKLSITPKNNQLLPLKFAKVKKKPNNKLFWHNKTIFVKKSQINL